MYNSCVLCAGNDRAALTMPLMLSAYWWKLVPTLMLVTQRCGHRCMLLPHVAISGFAATSANSQLQLNFLRLCCFVPLGLLTSNN